MQCPCCKRARPSPVPSGNMQMCVQTEHATDHQPFSAPHRSWDLCLSLCLKDTRGIQEWSQSPAVPSTAPSQLMANLLQEDEGQTARARGTATPSRHCLPFLVTPLGIHHSLFPVPPPKCQVHAIYDSLV